MKSLSLTGISLFFSLVLMTMTAHDSFAQNLVTNGDFSAGNTGFTSGYTSANPSTTGNGSSYAVVSNPSTDASSGWGNYFDHTLGTSAGRMLLLNGSPTLGVNFWQQTVGVTQNTDYVFSGWIANATASTSLANISFKINGSSIGNATVSSTVGSWTRFTGTWNSGSNTSAALALTDTNTDLGGNDFSVDDLSFARSVAVVPEANTIALLGLALPMIGAVQIARRKKK